MKSTNAQLHGLIIQTFFGYEEPWILLINCAVYHRRIAKGQTGLSSSDKEVYDRLHGEVPPTIPRAKRRRFEQNGQDETAPAQRRAIQHDNRGTPVLGVYEIEDRAGVEVTRSGRNHSPKSETERPVVSAPLPPPQPPRHGVRRIAIIYLKKGTGSRSNQYQTITIVFSEATRGENTRTIDLKSRERGISTFQVA